jgi:2'-5' RNA ligase
MRLFTAIDLPPESKAKIESLLDILRPAARIRWSRVDSLHITTKFIGDWPEERVDELKLALSEIPLQRPIEISLRGLGYFPNPHQPRVFWAAVHAPESLSRLAKLTEDAAASLGIERENKPYSPHLTLARLDNRKDPPGALGSLRRAVASIAEPDCGQFTAREWHLYRSELGPGGSRHTKLETFSLA